MNVHRFLIREIAPEQVWQVTNRQSQQMALVRREAGSAALISSTGLRPDDCWACQVLRSHLALANRSA